MTEYIHHDATPRTCVTCNTKMDKLTCPEDGRAAPNPGDLSVCLKCTQIYVIQNDRQSIKPATKEDLKKLSKEEREDLERVRAAVRRLIQAN